MENVGKPGAKFEMLLNQERAILRLVKNQPGVLRNCYSDGSTLLHQAAKCGSALLVYYIMVNNPDSAFWSKRDLKGRTAARDACAQGHMEVVAIMYNFFVLFESEEGICNLNLHCSVLSEALRAKYKKCLDGVDQIQHEMQNRISDILSAKTWGEYWNEFSGISTISRDDLLMPNQSKKDGPIVGARNKSADFFGSDLTVQSYMTAHSRNRSLGLRERKKREGRDGEARFFSDAHCRDIEPLSSQVEHLLSGK